MLRRAAELSVLALLVATQVQGGIISLQQGWGGYSGTADTWLDGRSGREDENNGADTTLHVRYDTGADRVALLRFDLTNDLPAGATINTAALSLYYYDRWSFVGTEQFDVAVYRCLRDWTEGNGVGQGGSARSGASWYYRHAYPDTAQWYNAGARGANQDRKLPADATVTITDQTPFGLLTWTSSALRDSVAAWAANPSSNYGWVIDYSYSNDQNGVMFWSRNVTSPYTPPKLELAYTGVIYWTGADVGYWDVGGLANWRATPNTQVNALYTNGDSPVFDDTASGTKSITIQSGGVTIGSMLVNTADTYLFYGGAIGGAGGSLTKAGTGTLVLGNSPNTYTGGTYITGGTLQLRANNVLPDYLVGISSGALLDLNGYNDAIGGLTLSSGTVSRGGTLTLGGDVTSTGTSLITDGTLALGGNRSIDVTNGSLTIESAITGAGHSLAKEGTGTLVLSNPSNSYSGGTFVQSGTLRLGASNVIPNHLLSISSGTVDLNGYNDTIGSLTLSNGTVSGAGTLTLGGNVTSYGTSTITGGTLALGGNRTFGVTDSLSIGSAITGAGNSLTKAGGGTLVLTNPANSYTGGTSVTAGTLRLGASEVIPNHAVSIAGATLDLNGYNETIGALTLSGGLVTGNGTLTLGGDVAATGSSSITATTLALGASRTFDVGFGSNLTIGSVIAGSGCGLTKSGAGTLALTGSSPNAYDGTTTVLGGTLVLGKSPGVSAIPGDLSVASGAVVRLAADENIAKTATVTLASGAQLLLYDPMALTGYAETIGGLVGSGTVDFGQPPLIPQFRLTIESLTDTTFTGTLTGAGGFRKTGPATFTLGGTHDYDGRTRVNEGTLVVTGSLTKTSEVQVASGATLIADGLIPAPIYVLGTLGGTGRVGNVHLRPGGTLSPGTSPGSLVAAASTWLAGGNYNWQIHDATGPEGVGYDVFLIEGLLNLAEASSFNINLWSLAGVNPDVSGPCLNFDNALPYEWTIAIAAGGIEGFDPAAFTIFTAPNNGTEGFANDLGGGSFSVEQRGDRLVLLFNPSGGQQVIPEPSSVAILAFGGLLSAVCRRRRRSR